MGEAERQMDDAALWRAPPRATRDGRRDGVLEKIPNEPFHNRNQNEDAMTSTKLGGALFAIGLVVIAGWAVGHYIIWPIICGVTAGCGNASW
jgi:hypothetical protein